MFGISATGGHDGDHILFISRGLLIPGGLTVTRCRPPRTGSAALALSASLTSLVRQEAQEALVAAVHPHRLLVDQGGFLTAAL